VLADYVEVNMYLNYIQYSIVCFSYIECLTRGCTTLVNHST